jgi:outer membrane protein OmpA-like peptidoglycan-associated protein
MTFLKTTTAIISLLAVLAPSVQAQELTADDILKRLQAQRSRTLGFVDASKPAGEAATEETALTMAPADDAGANSLAPTVDTSGLALAASDSGSGSGVQLSSTTSGTSTQSAATLGTATSQGTETLPTLATASATPLPPASEPISIDLTIYFDFDSAVLQTKSKTQLDALCGAIQSDAGEGTYQIIGHTDAKGKASYNQRLSQARADEVVRYMVGTCGIDKSRLQSVGAGEQHLKLPQEPRSPENRRVEVQVLS